MTAVGHLCCNSEKEIMPNDLLPREFYDRPTEVIARELLGATLWRESADGLTAGRIVETEAYLPENDSACHSARGKTRSNASIFGPPGIAYVYPIHSRHCMNAVTQSQGTGCAVLIRAIEPTDGIPLMQRRRKREALTDLTRGPARLCEAMALDRKLDGWDLTSGPPLWIAANGQPLEDARVGISQRIGVTSAKELRLRFFVKGNPFVSGPRRLNAGDS